MNCPNCGKEMTFITDEELTAKGYWVCFYPNYSNCEKQTGIVQGVGKDAPIVANEQGGKQSKVLYRFDLLDPKAMFEMTKVLEVGARKYGDDNWRMISIKEHLNHMIIHAYAYLAGDTSDEHLSHIMCRAMFAQAVAVQTEEDVQRAKKSLGLI